jgi:hypothetical protein
MAITLLCFLQGLDSSFPVTFDEKEIKTIKDLRDLIKISKKQSIIENNIDLDKFKIWKVSIPLNKNSSIEKLRKLPAEIEESMQCDDKQEILLIFDNIPDHIQVFIGNPTNPEKNQDDEEKILLKRQSTLAEQRKNDGLYCQSE